MNKYVGSLGRPASSRPACSHVCAHCGEDGTELLFSMTRDAVIQIVRDGRAENYTVHGVGGNVIHADLAEGSEQIPLPPPPPEVWLVYKHNGRYDHGMGPLQGIYSSEEGAKDSVRFAVKEERASLAERLGQPKTPHEAEEPVLRWHPVRHWRYGTIPGEFWAQAGLADFTVKKFKVPEGYLPRATWCKVPHLTEEES